MPILQRAETNPVLEPRPDAWDSYSTFNPGAIRHEGRIWMLYRAVSDQAQYLSRFGLAVSDDGRRFERAAEGPVFEPERDCEVGGVEDARITRDPGGDGFLVTYAAVSKLPGPIYEERDFFARARQDPFIERPAMPPMGESYTGLLRSPDLREFDWLGLITPSGIDDRDGVLFPEKVGGRYLMMHRPTAWTGPEYGTEKPGIWLAWSDDLETWDYGEPGEYLLMTPQAEWEGAKIGAGPPPVRTPEGWLVIYHGVDEDYVYRVGAALLDLQDPLRVVARTDRFLMEPERDWEQVGVIPNVVFPTAAVHGPDGELLIYYGGADRVVGLATAGIDRLLDHLLR
jgi:predicted GH43/DUF377 family glycosyl hydrolase